MHPHLAVGDLGDPLRDLVDRDVDRTLDPDLLVLVHAAHVQHDHLAVVAHGGEEFAYVLEGTVVVHTEHYAPAVLKAGESIYFDSR